MKLFAIITILFSFILGYGVYIKQTYTPAQPHYVDASATPAPAPLPVASIPPPPPVTATEEVNAVDVLKKVLVSESSATSSIVKKRDNTPPTTPYGAFAVYSENVVRVSWYASRDNVGVQGYKIYRDNILIANTPRTVLDDFGISSPFLHKYSITAYDESGNVSPPTKKIIPVGDKFALTLTPSPITPPAPPPTLIVVRHNPPPPPSISPVPPPPASPTPTPPPTPTSSPLPPPNPPPPPPDPPPPPPACGSGGTCTASEIAPHNVRSDCWVYLSPINKVYNITNYVANGNTHPGKDVIVPHCGTNIYEFFYSTTGHTHSSSALNVILQAYYIGAFQ